MPIQKATSPNLPSQPLRNGILQDLIMWDNVPNYSEIVVLIFYGFDYKRRALRVWETFRIHSSPCKVPHALIHPPRTTAQLPITTAIHPDLTTFSPMQSSYRSPNNSFHSSSPQTACIESFAATTLAIHKSCLASVSSVLT